MKQYKLKIMLGLLLVLAIINSPTLLGQSALAWSKADTNSIMIGEQINLEIGISIPEGVQVKWPVIQDTLTKEIEVIYRSPVDTLLNEGVLRLIQQLTITSFDSGYFAIPPQDFLFSKKQDPVLQKISSNALHIKVTVPLVDTAQAIKPIVGPIAEPYTFRELLPWILLGLLIIGLIVLAIVLIKKRKRKQPLFERKQKPALPPDIVAIQKLEELRLAKVWQNGQLKKYHSQLSDIIREYLDNRYQFDAPEMTSDEILSTLKELDVNKEVFEKLKGVMFLADMVKFAKAQPTALENDLSLAHCVDFVNETKTDLTQNTIDKTSNIHLKNT